MDWKSIGTSAIGTGLNILGGWASSAINNRYQKELMAYQNEWNLEQWHRQNEYNSPIQQMARYQEAGLNPNLIYSQGSPGNSQQVPSAASANLQAPDFSRVGTDFTTTFMNYQGQASQIALNDSMANKNNQEANLTKVQTAYEQLKVVEQQLLNKNLPEQIRLDLQTKAEQLRGIVLGNNFAEDTYGNRVATVAEQLEGVKKTNALIDQNIEIAKKNNEKLAFELENMQKVLNAQLNLMYAQANQANAAATLSREQANEIRTLLADKADLLHSEAFMAIPRMQAEINSLMKATTATEIANKINSITYMLMDNPSYQTTQVLKHWTSLIGDLSHVVVGVSVPGGQGAKSAK